MICPACGKSDQTDKVSAIYIQGLERGRQSVGAASQAEPAHSRSPVLLGKTALECRELSRRLAPPSAGKRLPTRPLHPDMVVIAYSLILPVFLYGILTSQRPLILPLLGLLAVSYGLYLWKRKAMVAKFESQVAARQAADERIKNAIERWMKLYYCARDDGVFIPPAGRLLPADQMLEYLYESPAGSSSQPTH
jgi:hypothetical protein